MAELSICRECKFWEPMRIRNRGVCHRFPTTLETAISHWCGEHRPKAVVHAEPVEDEAEGDLGESKKGRKKNV